MRTFRRDVAHAARKLADAVVRPATKRSLDEIAAADWAV
jgi:hypothetical protein